MITINRKQAISGSALALVAVALTATTDLLAKVLAGELPLAQVNFLAALVGIVGAWALSRGGRFGGGGLRTAFPGPMALRALSAVAAAVCFFLAYKNLQLTEVFVFASTLPIFAGLMSGPLLGEPVAPRHWLALAASTLGVALAMPMPGSGHLLWGGFALAGSLFGALSLTMARLIGRHERNAAALVFYPQLALALIMGLALPGQLVPMSLSQIALTITFGLGFLLGKMALAAAFSRAPAMVVTPVVNLQFFALLGLGYVVFGDMPDHGIYIGAAIVTVAGFYVTFGGQRAEQLRLATAATSTPRSEGGAALRPVGLRSSAAAPPRL